MRAHPQHRRGSQSVPPTKSPPVVTVVIATASAVMADVICGITHQVLHSPRVVVCRSGQDALMALRSTPAALVIMELSLPDIDGMDLVPVIVTERLTSAVLILSARNDERTREFRVRANVEGYVDVAHSDLGDIARAIRDVVAGDAYYSAPAPLEPSRQGDVPLNKILSPAEFQAFAVLSEGLDDNAAAARLALSPHTVHTHRRAIMRRLGLTCSRELTFVALRRGVIRVAADRILHPGMETVLAERAVRGAVRFPGPMVPRPPLGNGHCGSRATFVAGVLPSPATATVNATAKPMPAAVTSTAAVSVTPFPPHVALGRREPALAATSAR